MKSLLAVLLCASVSACGYVNDAPVASDTTNTTHHLVCNALSLAANCEEGAERICPNGHKILDSGYEMHTFAPSGRYLTVQCDNSKLLKTGS